jgi:hypothetical protein
VKIASRSEVTTFGFETLTVELPRESSRVVCIWREPPNAPWMKNDAFTIAGDNQAISKSPVVTRDSHNVLMFPQERKFRSTRADPIRFTNALIVPKIADLDCCHEFNARRSFIVRVADLFIAPFHSHFERRRR